MQTHLDADAAFYKESPEYFRVSLAAAMTLGWVHGRFYRDAKLFCINLLATYRDGCYANCSYCGLSKRREGEYDKKSFIRVDWPVFPLSDIVGRAKNVRHIKRICISMIMNPKATEDTLIGVEYIRYHLKIPVSILIAPPIVDREYLERLKYSGVDAIGVAIDTATQELFNRYRTPLRWESYWEIFREAVDTFGKNRVGAHLIVGLGETEREMVEAIQKVRELGGKTHLFSFYPENGSALEGMRPCEAGRFRRIQLARYLIDNDMITLDDISFDEKERIAGFNFDVDKIISSGKPFMTSGCRGCNRPYGDSTPGDIRSYPFVLSERDVEIVREQIWDYGRGGNFDKINYTL